MGNIYRERNLQRSFTLIELLVVVAIIGLLASITLVALKGAIDRARIGKAMSFSGQIYRSLAADAVGIWNFNDGTANDSSGNGNNGTIYGDATYVDGIPELGKALKFDGNDYVDAGSAASLKPASAITVEAWVYSTKDPSEWQTIVNMRYADAADPWNSYILDRTTGNKWNVCVSSGTPGSQVCVVSDTAFTANRWYHLVGTYDGSYVSLYENGVLATAPVAKTGNLGYSTNTLKIGALNDLTSVRFFKGIIDEVRIYRQAMTSAQIQKHYAEGLERFKLAEN